MQALPNQHRCNDVQAGTLEEKHVRRKKKEEGLQNYYETSGEKIPCRLLAGQNQESRILQSTHETNSMQINCKSSSVLSTLIMWWWWWWWWSWPSFPHQEGLSIIFPHCKSPESKSIVPRNF